MKFYWNENVSAEDEEILTMDSEDAAETYTEITEEEVPLANLSTSERGDGMIFAGAGIALAVILAVITGYVSFGEVKGVKRKNRRQ